MYKSDSELNKCTLPFLPLANLLSDQVESQLGCDCKSNPDTKTLQILADQLYFPRPAVALSAGDQEKSQ